MTAVTPGTTAAGTMTAIVQDDYGTAPEAVLRLAEITRPAIADDEILVQVGAASVDRGSWHLMAGLANPMRLAGSYHATADRHGIGWLDALIQAAASTPWIPETG